jgi:hypothetical protein
VPQRGAAQRLQRRRIAQLVQGLSRGVPHFEHRPLVVQHRDDVRCLLDGAQLAQCAEDRFAPSRTRIVVLFVLESGAVAKIGFGRRVGQHLGQRFDRPPITHQCQCSGGVDPHRSVFVLQQGGMRRQILRVCADPEVDAAEGGQPSRHAAWREHGPWADSGRCRRAARLT